MEIYKNIKKGTKIGLIISMIFVIIGIGGSIYNLIESKPTPSHMIEAQNQPSEIPNMKDIPSMPNTQEPTIEMTNDKKYVPSSSPEVPTAGIPGYIKDVIFLIVYFLTGLYAILGYKKPHGNMLKYLFIAFATALALNICLGKAVENTVSAITTIFTCLASLILTYISGRLNKIGNNRVLLILTGVLLFAASMLPIFGGNFIINGLLNSFSPLIMLFALGFAYTARYEEHKVAGLEEGK